MTQFGNRAWPIVFRWLIAISLCCAGGFFVLFTTWAPYDDEGYILWTLIHQSQSHVLYDEIFTQYGPAFYWLDSTLRSVIPFPRTTDGQRWQTLFFWLAITTLATATLKNLVSNRFENHSATGSLFLLSSFGLIFWHLDRLAMEPGHPQNWCTLLTVTLYWLLTHPTIQKTETFSLPRCLLLGTICGVLMMIKPNVGILAIAGLPASLLWNSYANSSRLLRLFDLAYSMALCSLSWLIMHRQLGNANNWLHPLLVSGSILLLRMEHHRFSSLLSTYHSEHVLTIPFTLTLQRLAAISIGTFLPILAFILWSLQQGSQLAQIQYALFGQHQALMTLYYYPVFQTAIPWISTLAAITLLATLCYRNLPSHFLAASRATRQVERRWFEMFPTALPEQFTIFKSSRHSQPRVVLILVSIVTSLCLLWTILESSTPLVHGLRPRGIAGLLLAAMPWLVWYWVRNRSNERHVAEMLRSQPHSVAKSQAPDKLDGRLSLASIVIMQTLIAFPVPGTQFSLGTLGLLLLGLDIARTAFRDLVDQTINFSKPQRNSPIIANWYPATLLLLLLPVSLAAWRYHTRESLQLPGATLLRLSAENTKVTRELVNTFKQLEVDTIVFQWHNRNSWLLWADRQPLSYALPPSWPYLLTPQHQQQSYKALRNASRVAIVDEDYGLQRAPDCTLLQDTWQSESQSVRRIGEFEVKLWRPKIPNQYQVPQEDDKKQPHRG